MPSSAISELTILFADIAGSTRMYERLGDQQARSLVSACIDLICAAVSRTGGQVVKTIGDEVMCTFPMAQQAANAAVAMQEELACHATLSAHHIKLRIGLHHGAVIHEAEDVFGDAVNLAARVTGQAKADQILTTAETLMQIRTDAVSTARLVDQTRVKGKQELIELYELPWGKIEEMTMLGQTEVNRLPMPADSACPPLTITYNGQTWLLSQNQPSLSLGRDETNHLVVMDQKVSRLHARIEIRRGRYLLIDQSTNGTYVQPVGGEPVMLHRDLHPLSGKGLIGLGQIVSATSPAAITYEASPDHCNS